MIRKNDGEKLTAKQAAAHEIQSVIYNALCCADATIDREAMTEKETAEYLRHLNLYEERISKVLGGVFA